MLNSIATAHLLGVDLGTSSVKAGLLDLSTGQLQHFSATEYSDYSEYDADPLWERALQTMKETIAKLGAKGDVIGIGISGQMHGAVLYDKDGDIIDKLINWRDKRKSDPKTIEQIRRIAGQEALQSLGTEMASGYTGTILYWLKQNNPNVFKNIHHIVLFTDFLRSKLIGKNDYATDQTNAASTGLFNTRQNEWHYDLIRQLDLPIGIFPQVHRSSEVAGVLSQQIADSLNVKPEIPIIYGGGDNQMSMLGSGIVSPRSPTLINVGTGAQISKVIHSYHAYPGIDTRPFFDGQYALVGASLGGGGHYGDFIKEIKNRGLALGYPEVDNLTLDVPAGSDGLYYCTGPSRTNPDRKRGFFGDFSKRDDIGHQARAIIEGILMDLYEFHAVIKPYDDNETIVGSGKALVNSIAWRQIASELFGKRLQIFNTENALVGASILAGRGVKYFHDPGDWKNIIRYEDGALPNRANMNFYAEHFVSQWQQQVEQFTFE